MAGRDLIGSHVETRDPRFAGDSKYPFPKLVRLASDGIASFSTAPIKLLTRVGFVMIIFCAGVLAWTLYTRFFTHNAPQGWTSVLAIVLLLGGMPTWEHSRSWGYGPSGVVGLLLIILLVLMIMSYVPLTGWEFGPHAVVVR